MRIWKTHPPESFVYGKTVSEAHHPKGQRNQEPQDVFGWESVAGKLVEEFGQMMMQAQCWQVLG